MKGFRLAALMLALLLCMSGAPAMASEDQPYAGTTITVYNWFDYISPEVLEMFTEQTGIQVEYVNFTTTEEMYTKLQAGAGSYDVIVPSDYIIERLIADGQLAELDHSAMPNVEGLIDWLQSPDYDPGCAYSVPYMWGTVGILYNTNMVDEEITSWKQMFDPKYQNAVFMLGSIRDTLGATLKMLGYSMNTRDQDELNAARDALIQQKQDGIVAGYLVDEVKDKMIAGEAAMALMWSGDAAYAIHHADGDYLKYVVPEEGSNVWVDAMCVPKDSQHVEAAQEFINFMCDPEIAYLNQQFIYYCTPIQATLDMLTEEELAAEELNPSPETVDRCEFFHDTSEYADMYETIWVDIRMAG